MTTNPKSQTPDFETLALRRMSKVLSLWGLCARQGCRRARACRGNPHDCLPRYSPLVPEQAREGAEAMAEGWRLDLPFDQLFEQAPDELDALGAWARTVQASADRPRAKRKRAGGKPDER